MFKAERLTERTGVFLNLVIILASLFFIGFLIKKFLITQRARPSSNAYTTVSLAPPLKIGERFPLSDVDWAKSELTLVLAFSPRHSFEENASFYQVLWQKQKGKVNYRFLPIVAGAANEGHAYLKALGIPVDEIRHVPLKSLGILVDPTLVLVNRSGVVSQVWKGKLAPSQFSEVLNQLAINVEAVENKNNATLISTRDLGLESPRQVLTARNLDALAHYSITDGKAKFPASDYIRKAIEEDRRFTIVDVRDRQLYSQALLAIGRNIPFDELEVRVPNEITPLT
jgi:rhodanese-related sulfurtransferase